MLFKRRENIWKTEYQHSVSFILVNIIHVCLGVQRSQMQKMMLMLTLLFFLKRLTIIMQISYLDKSNEEELKISWIAERKKQKNPTTTGLFCCPKLNQPHHFLPRHVRGTREGRGADIWTRACGADTL